MKYLLFVALLGCEDVPRPKQLSHCGKVAEAECGEYVCRAGLEDGRRVTVSVYTPVVSGDIVCSRLEWFRSTVYND